MTIKTMNEKAKQLSANDRVGLIMSYEDGEISLESTLILFGNLIETGLAWSLQGAYGRTATNIINNGLINRQGEIISVPKGGN